MCPGESDSYIGDIRMSSDGQDFVVQESSMVFKCVERLLLGEFKISSRAEEETNQDANA